jgi:hypothetical protein
VHDRCILLAGEQISCPTRVRSKLLDIVNFSQDRCENIAVAEVANEKFMRL